MKEINNFSGEYKFLSNFYLWPIKCDGLMYPALENAFQAQKSLDEEGKLEFQNITPGKAKQRGRQIECRKDWDKIRNKVMFDLLCTKFNDDELGPKLMATYPAKLVEGNWWGDEYWGRCNGKGKNVLGKLLMDVRDALRKQMSELDP